MRQIPESTYCVNGRSSHVDTKKKPSHVNIKSDDTWDVSKRTMRYTRASTSWPHTKCHSDKYNRATSTARIKTATLSACVTCISSHLIPSSHLISSHHLVSPRLATRCPRRRRFRARSHAPRRTDVVRRHSPARKCRHRTASVQL